MFDFFRKGVSQVGMEGENRFYILGKCERYDDEKWQMLVYGGEMRFNDAMCAFFTHFHVQCDGNYCYI